MHKLGAIDRVAEPAAKRTRTSAYWSSTSPLRSDSDLQLPSISPPLPVPSPTEPVKAMPKRPTPISGPLREIQTGPTPCRDPLQLREGASSRRKLSTPGNSTRDHSLRKDSSAHVLPVVQSSFDFRQIVERSMVFSAFPATREMPILATINIPRNRRVWSLDALFACVGWAGSTESSSRPLEHGVVFIEQTRVDTLVASLTSLVDTLPSTALPIFVFAIDSRHPQLRLFWRSHHV
jgi:hypothetical protein